LHPSWIWLDQFGLLLFLTVVRGF